MARSKWHEDVIKKLIEELSPRLEPKTKKLARQPISHPTKQKIRMKKGYEPDIVVERNNQKIIIEVETYSSPCKILENIIFSSIAGATQLVMIFSNKGKKKGEGQTRVEEANNLYGILKARFENSHTRLIKPKVHFVNDENDEKIGEICSELNQ